MAAGRDAPRFQVWRVLHRMVQFFIRNAVTFFILALITGIPAAIFRFEEAKSDTPWTAGGPSMVPLILFAVSSYLLCAAITKATLLDLSGKRPTPREGFLEVWADFLALLAIGAVTAFLSLVGYMFLLLPGLLVDTFLSLVIPLRTIERVPMSQVFVLSIRRTRGYRWPIFGLNAGTTAFYFAAVMAVNVITGYPLLDGVLDASSDAGTGRIWGTVVADTLLGIIGSLLYVSVYYELRLINAGREPEGLASVFD